MMPKSPKHFSKLHEGVCPFPLYLLAEPVPGHGNQGLYEAPMFLIMVQYATILPDITIVLDGIG
jgi:hypothetical protein